MSVEQDILGYKKVQTAARFRTALRKSTRDNHDVLRELMVNIWENPYGLSPNDAANTISIVPPEDTGNSIPLLAALLNVKYTMACDLVMAIAMVTPQYTGADVSVVYPLLTQAERDAIEEYVVPAYNCRFKTEVVPYMEGTIMKAYVTNVPWSIWRPALAQGVLPNYEAALAQETAWNNEIAAQ